ncbi:deoxyribonuclease-2-like [Tropilaelaps mercedesae]|uniref:Deoxyribonuclease-2-like n=1 Tax=Tropilaelaps mercedesae TaxID=418985 RepID=A0A1V9XRS3_9ACAR|nr:deoxyribonuclease-2-like [Tropilaelaps mercedesae]
MIPYFLLLLGLAAPLVFAAPQCKNQDGKDVEWFIIYKLPKTKPSDGSDFATNGSELAYVDSTMKSTTKGWTLLEASAFDTKGNPFALTLADLFMGLQPKNTLYAVYNDQPPEPYNGTAKGHTKGVIEFTKDGGYWLMHSVPRFPLNVLTKRFEFPQSSVNNGQVFMCISLSGDHLNKVVAALRQQYPYIYESNAPSDLLQDEDVRKLMDKKFVRRPINPILQDTLVGVNGTEFQSFAKHQAADDEIYSKIVAPKLGVDMLAETWRNGAGGKLGPTCPLKGVTVTNMANVVIHFNDGRKVVFKTTEDHAKWAVSDNIRKPWFCNGSLNRMLSQYKRGGQTTCISNKLVHRLFTKAVEKCEMCDGTRAEKNFCKERVNE